MVNAPVEGAIFPIGVLFNAVIAIETPLMLPPVIWALLVFICEKVPTAGVVPPITELLIVLLVMIAFVIVSELKGGEKNSPPGPTKPMQMPLTSKIA